VSPATRAPAPQRTLTLRELNRAMLARQMLLAREKLTVVSAIERLVALQAQWSPSPYVALWSRVRDFKREALWEAIEKKRTVVRARLMRGTLHLVSSRDFYAFAVATQDLQRGADASTEGRRRRAHHEDGRRAGRTVQLADLAIHQRARGPRCRAALRPLGPRRHRSPIRRGALLDKERVAAERGRGARAPRHAIPRRVRTCFARGHREVQRSGPGPRPSRLGAPPSEARDVRR